MHAGNRARRSRLIDEALAINREAIDPATGLPEADGERRAYLMKGDRGAALDALDAGVHAGWKDAMFLERDPLLARLRGEPRFQSIEQRIEREVGEKRARADFSSLDEWAGAPVTGQ